MQTYALVLVSLCSMMSFTGITFRFAISAAALVFLTMASCSFKSAEEEALEEQKVAEEQRIADSVTAANARKARLKDSLSKLFPPIRYSRLHVRNSAVLDSVRRVFGKRDSTWDNYRVLTLLNRKDIQFVRVGDSLVVPDTIIGDLRAYSMFPMYYEAADTINKIVLISNAWQCYAAYEKGVLVRFAAVNSGEERKPTLPGRYAVNWKQRKRLSSLDSTWVLPFTVNFHQYAGSAFHQFEMPGRPVSHSCVRQFMTDAEWLFKWVKQARLDTVRRRPIPFTGTPVIILDIFDFTRRRGGPWLELTGNDDVTISLPPNPMTVEEALIPISQIPKMVRGALPDHTRYAKAEEVLRDRGIIREGVQLRESIDFNKLRREKKKRQEAEQKRKADSASRREG